MVTFEDCLALCELTEDEIDAIAEHEHLPDTVALEMGSCLIRGREASFASTRSSLTTSAPRSGAVILSTRRA